MSKTGILNLTREEYDAVARVNFSTLKHLGRSPMHYRSACAVGTKETPAKSLGNATHVAVLEPQRFAQSFVTYSKRRAGGDWDAFRAAYAGKTILSEDEAKKCAAMQLSVRNHPTASRYLGVEGRCEVSVLWDLEAQATGAFPGYRFEMKGRLDFLTTSAIVDLKSTRDASVEGFGRECAKYRYHAQSALYQDGVHAVTGERLPYVIVAVENVAPYAVTVFRVPDSVLAAGREEYFTLLGRLDACRNSNSWPGYAEGEVELSLPAWAVKFFDEEEPENE